MGKKTMVLRNFALLPKSAEMVSAMQADNGIRVDLTPTANAAEVTERPPRVVASLVENEDAPADEDPGNPGAPGNGFPNDPGDGKDGGGGD
jgi:recombination protein RecT